MDGWLKEAAPSSALRQWFWHDPQRWAEFKRRYFAELDGAPDAWKPLLTAARGGAITLLYSARAIRSTTTPWPYKNTWSGNWRRAPDGPETPQPDASAKKERP
jgi:hypothetical protein